MEKIGTEWKHKAKPLEFCNTIKYHRPAPGVSLRSISPAQVGDFDTKSYSFCSGHNLEIPADYADLNCHNRCHGVEEGNISECFGYRHDLGPHDLSICANRTMCEEICVSMDDCASIDMVKGLPRCYMNSACDDAEVVHNSAYDLLIKRTPNSGKDLAITTSNAFCNETLGLEARYDRIPAHWRPHLCEEKCPCDPDEDPGCTGCEAFVAGMLRGAGFGVGKDVDIFPYYVLDYYHYYRDDAYYYYDFGFFFTWDLHDEAYDLYDENVPLCIPREQCEMACKDTEGCHSFTVAQQVSRCYLLFETAHQCEYTKF